MKTITIRTTSKHLAVIIKEEIESLLDEHVNCTWYDGAWEVGADGEAEEIDAIAADYRECDNYKDGLFTIELTVEQ